MANNTITGDLPSSLENLTRLEYLNFTENRMSGPLPEYLFTHPQLTHIILDDNAFTGTLSPLLGSSPCPLFWVRNNKLTGQIPSSVGRSLTLGTAISMEISSQAPFQSLFPALRSGPFCLEIINFLAPSPRASAVSRGSRNYVGGNEQMGGAIPSELGQCTYLQDIYIYNNTAMTGTLPTELGSLRFLRYVYLHNNRFDGSIPSELGNLRALEELWLRDNRLTGAIPTEIAGCHSLTYTDLDGNYLTGAIAPVIDSLPRSLVSFDVGANQLEGTIPSSIASLSLLDWFEAHNNKSNGTIPNELGSLSQLEWLNLGYNNFTGSVPSSLASLPRLVNLRVQGNDLTGSLGAEFCQNTFETLAANTCSEPDKMACACCTHCCRLDTWKCKPL